MTHRNTCRALARLLCYPDDQLIAQLPQITEVLALAPGLSSGTRQQLAALAAELLQGDWVDIESRYVEAFDRGRRTSLHLFEHVHGDSRDRGPAMIDLRQTYEAAGLFLGDGELPDFLPVVLEFASTQPVANAQGFLGEMAHILNALHAALAQRESPYAAVIAAALELAGEPVQAVAVPAEEPVDASWAEPDAFGGCNSNGQQKPEAPQTIHIVRPSAQQRGAAA